MSVPILTSPLPGDEVRIHADNVDGALIAIGYGWLVLPRHPLVQALTSPGDRLPVILGADPQIGTWVAPRLLERLRPRVRRGNEVAARYPHFAVGPVRSLLRPGNGQRTWTTQRERPTACGEYHPADAMAISPRSRPLTTIEIPHVTDTPEYVRCRYCRRAIGLPEGVPLS